MSNCLYEKIGFVSGTGRMRYKAGCGLDVVQMDHEFWDGFQLNREDIKGLCMKCRKKIEITSPVANEPLLGIYHNNPYFIKDNN